MARHRTDGNAVWRPTPNTHTAACRTLSQTFKVNAQRLHHVHCQQHPGNPHQATTPVTSAWLSVAHATCSNLLRSSPPTPVSRLWASATPGGPSSFAPGLTTPHSTSSSPTLPTCCHCTKNATKHNHIHTFHSMLSLQVPAPPRQGRPHRYQPCLPHCDCCCWCHAAGPARCPRSNWLHAACIFVVYRPNHRRSRCHSHPRQQPSPRKPLQPGAGMRFWEMLHFCAQTTLHTTNFLSTFL